MPSPACEPDEVWGLWYTMELNGSQTGAPELGLCDAGGECGQASRMTEPLLDSDWAWLLEMKLLQSRFSNKHKWSPAAFELGDKGDKGQDSGSPLHPPCLPRVHAVGTPGHSSVTTRGSVSGSIQMPPEELHDTGWPCRDG